MKLVASLMPFCPFVITACAAPAAVDQPANPVAADAPSPAAPTTRYRVGDFVVYRYSGGFSPTPVVLREEVRAQEGNRLRIDVTATRGAEELRWIQVLTDTPENQRNNVIDALYEVKDGTPVKLDNPDNRDAFRLYQWTLIMPEGRATDVKQAPCERDIGSVKYACSCTTGKNTWHGRAVEFEDVECPEFLWTHASGRFGDVAGGEDVHRADVVEVGRRSDAIATTLLP
ncbi:MAG: hypothetical protein HYS27_06905 [Deltaproteobacteria bacterium]|nr:hypothetical protein [Deltaproteobacteria bacterium]